MELNQWYFVALRFNENNEVTLTCLDRNASANGVAQLKKASETFKISDKLQFPSTMLPRIGSNAKGDGNFFEGSIDEIGLTNNYVPDEALFKAYLKMQNP